MSRVEPKDRPAAPPREAQERSRKPTTQTPGQAEGEEQAVDEALRNAEKKRL